MSFSGLICAVYIGVMASRFPFGRTLLVGDPYYLLRRDAYKIPGRLSTVGSLIGIVPVVSTEGLILDIARPYPKYPKNTNTEEWHFGERGDFFEYLPMGKPWIASEYLSICTVGDLQRWHECHPYKLLNTLISDFRYAYDEGSMEGFASRLPSFPFLFSTHTENRICTVSAIIRSQTATGLSVRIKEHFNNEDNDGLFMEN